VVWSGELGTCLRRLALIDVRVLDHIIVTETGHYSFADKGQL
jgi:DNA repair protein RadC